MEPLTGVVQNYAWGSHSALAELRGDPPTADPEAELWFGAHPSASSVLSASAGTRTLGDIIDADPAGQLGPPTVERFGARLPYLLKILAAAQPLSIQVHPSKAQAEAGFAREEAAGIDRTAPHRSFRDDNHKPELIAALTEFEALVGFRDGAETIDFLESLAVAALSPVVSTLRSEGIGAALTSILRAPRPEAEPLVDDLARACAAVDDGDWVGEADLLVRLADTYPGDPGVLTAALLNRVVLRPGQALYLGAGTLHAYVGGVGVEIMANSDNVLRGGLTPKHMDVDALIEIVDPRPMPPEILPVTGPLTVYPTPAPEFELTRLDAPNGVVRRPRGPEIVLAVSAPAEVTTPAETHRIGRGEALWVPAGTVEPTIRSDGLVFVAGIGALHSSVG